MSTPGNDGNMGWLRSAALAQLISGRPLPLPADHPGRPWLEWLRVPLSAGPAPELPSADSTAPASGLPPVVEDIPFSARQAQQAGLVPDVVYGCMIQTWWHPGQREFAARSRSEVVACFSADELDLPGWPLTLELMLPLNAYRLGELTPSELLTLARPLWPEPPAAEDEAATEAWVLLHLAELRRLQDVADCLRPFFPSTPPLGWSAERVQHNLESPEPEALQALRVPPGLEWADVQAMLGRERIQTLLGS